jgi:hypothetical protein
MSLPPPSDHRFRFKLTPLLVVIAMGIGIPFWDWWSLTSLANGCTFQRKERLD